MKEIKDSQTFDSLIKGDKPVVCDFFATWCGPCKMLAPVMEKASAEFADRAEFIKVDVDECMDLAARYGIMSIPFVAVFKGGEMCAKTVGYMNDDELRSFLAPAINRV